jgi:glycyl-tRNA synthetase
MESIKTRRRQIVSGLLWKLSFRVGLEGWGHHLPGPRVRATNVVEVEHYDEPKGGKKQPRFDEIDAIELVLLDRHTQLAGNTDVKVMAVGQAMKTGVIDNETLGYYLARIHRFLQRIGGDMNKVRFRQHMANEMAHYATDCWDDELLTSYGWIECVSCADRSAYNLTSTRNAPRKPSLSVNNSINH